MCVTHTNASYKTFSPWYQPVTKEEFNNCLLKALRKTQNFSPRENRARLQETACHTVPETEAGWSRSLSSLGGLGNTGWARVLNKALGSPCHDLWLQVMVCHQNEQTQNQAGSPSHGIWRPAVSASVMATVDLITTFSQITNCILRSVRGGGKDRGEVQKVLTSLVKQRYGWLEEMPWEPHLTVKGICH